MVKDPPADAGDVSSIPGSLGKMPQEAGMATPCSILAWRNPMDRGAWQGYGPKERKESDTAG